MLLPLSKALGREIKVIIEYISTEVLFLEILVFLLAIVLVNNISIDLAFISWNCLY